MYNIIIICIDKISMGTHSIAVCMYMHAYYIILYPHPTSMSHLGPKVGTATSHGTKEVLNLVLGARHFIFLALSACSFALLNLSFIHAYMYTRHACAYAYKHTESCC